MKKTTTPSSSYSSQVVMPAPGPRKSTLMLLRQFARTYGIASTQNGQNSCLALN